MDISKRYKYIPLIVPQVATSTVTGTGVDTMGYNKDCIAMVTTGTNGTDTSTCTVTIETSASLNGTYAVRTTFVAIVGTDDNESAAAKVVLDGASRRFVRAVATLATGTPSFSIAVGILVNAEYQSADLNSLTSA